MTYKPNALCPCTDQVAAVHREPESRRRPGGTMTNTCSTCAYKSDGLNARTPNYCYCFDKEVANDDPGCEEWRGSLRTDPLLGPDEQLVIAVAEKDTEVEG